MGEEEKGVWVWLGNFHPWMFIHAHPSHDGSFVRPPNNNNSNNHHPTAKPVSRCAPVMSLLRPKPTPTPELNKASPGRQKPPARHEQPGAGRQSPLPLTQPTSAAEREPWPSARPLPPPHLPGPRQKEESSLSTRPLTPTPATSASSQRERPSS